MTKKIILEEVERTPEALEDWWNAYSTDIEKKIARYDAIKSKFWRFVRSSDYHIAVLRDEKRDQALGVLGLLEEKTALTDADKDKLSEIRHHMNDMHEKAEKLRTQAIFLGTIKGARRTYLYDRAMRCAERARVSLAAKEKAQEKLMVLYKETLGRDPKLSRFVKKLTKTVSPEAFKAVQNQKTESVIPHVDTGTQDPTWGA